MSYNPNDQLIQRTYNRYYGNYVVGSQSQRDYGAPNPTATARTAVALSPGDGVYYDVNGNWIIPPTDVDAGLVTHIATFRSQTESQTVATPTTNATTFITYPANAQPVDAFAGGIVVVTLGEDVNVYERLAYQTSTGTYVLATTITPTVPYRLVIVALATGTAGNSIPVRFNLIG